MQSVRESWVSLQIINQMRFFNSMNGFGFQSQPRSKLLIILVLPLNLWLCPMAQKYQEWSEWPIYKHFTVKPSDMLSLLFLKQHVYDWYLFTNEHIVLISTWIHTEIQKNHTQQTMQLLCVSTSLRKFVKITFTLDFFHHGMCKNGLTALLILTTPPSFKLHAILRCWEWNIGIDIEKWSELQRMRVWERANGVPKCPILIKK